MESAIPQHLMRPRTQSANLKPGWQPPYPSSVARFKPSVRHVAMAYFGVQYQGEPPDLIRAALADLAAACTNADGPGQVDRARYVDEAGYTTLITIAYWDDPESYDRWFVPVRTMWLGDQHASGEAGFFIEAAPVGDQVRDAVLE